MCVVTRDSALESGGPIAGTPRMIDTVDRPRLGRYILTRPVATGPLADRWLCVHQDDQTSHVAYRFPVCHDKPEQRRFVDAVQRVSALEHPHILRIEQFFFDVAGRPWIVTPFTGDVDGLVTLSWLLRDKGGEMHPDEAERALTQLLEACACANDADIHHGPISMHEILVDRSGSLSIELYGLNRGLRGLLQGNAELVRDEVRSIVELGYQLITGLRTEEPVIPAGRLVKRLDPAWDAWLDEGLDPTLGFDTADEALAALPSRVAMKPVKRQSSLAVRTVFDRFRTTKR